MKNTLRAFNEEVLLKYNLLNSIFTTLPLDGIHNTGVLIPLLKEACEKGLSENKTPDVILDKFFEKHTQYTTDKEKLDFMFRIIQYVERQVVLVDALEDAAYEELNNFEGLGSFSKITERAENTKLSEELQLLLKDFAVRIVLTAHPTQFYPGRVLAIITDLTQAVQQNDIPCIQSLLHQLGKTAFFQKEKPSPYDEAVNLIWYLENIFYQASGQLFKQVHQLVKPLEDKCISNQLISFGFWPGGDRDGNPFVNTKTTKQVAKRLQTVLYRCYYWELRKLRRRLSFDGIYEKLWKLEQGLLETMNDPCVKEPIKATNLLSELNEIEVLLNEKHHGLFVEELRDFSYKVMLFKDHFASIDIRQDSRVIKATFEKVMKHEKLNYPLNGSSTEQMNWCFNLQHKLESFELDEAIENDTLQCFFAIQDIQEKNGPLACHRFIISNCRDASDVARVFALANMTSKSEKIILDIVPLFETISDLQLANETMNLLYANSRYKSHIDQRSNRQTVMLGFSDGTKDGGYVSANWNIYKAKEKITDISRQASVDVLFFDGRGGPPARGGGNTHKFYASLGSKIENKEIQLTVQGQTISSNFGTIPSAKYNTELLMAAGLENQLFQDKDKDLSADEKALLEELAQDSQDAYEAFKSHEQFVPYLEKMSALTYYGMAKIGSRPSKRKASKQLNLDDLRAIPFVGAWSQMKQNVPGFFGFGAALAKQKQQGNIEKCQALYSDSAFFKTLVENSMQSLCKTNFQLTNYIAHDKEFGDFWRIIHEEATSAISLLLEISGQTQLLENNPSIKESIKLREEIVLPLVTIQQYGLIKLREMVTTEKSHVANREVYQKLVVRSLYGNINASRNSA